jgi:hypothetical protein
MTIFDSVVGGIARTFDLFGVLHKPTKTKSTSDAIAEDWRHVGDDMRKTFQREIPKSTRNEKA